MTDTRVEEAVEKGLCIDEDAMHALLGLLIQTASGSPAGIEALLLAFDKFGDDMGHLLHFPKVTQLSQGSSRACPV